MLKLLKRNRKPVSRIPYNNCDIPARLFFNNLSKGDLSVLGTGTEEELRKAYYDILDEYCELDNNKSLKDAYYKEELISFISAQISTLETAIYTIAYGSLSKEERISIIDSLNEWKSPNPKINFNKDKPIIDEVLRIKKNIIGSLSNRLRNEIDTRKKHAANVKRTFEADCVAIEISLSVKIDDNVTLRKFVEYSKQAIERAKQYNKK